MDQCRVGGKCTKKVPECPTKYALAEPKRDNFSSDHKPLRTGNRFAPEGGAAAEDIRDGEEAATLGAGRRSSAGEHHSGNTGTAGMLLRNIGCVLLRHPLLEM